MRALPWTLIAYNASVTLFAVLTGKFLWKLG